LADPKVGPVFAAWGDVTVRLTPDAVIAWDMRQADQQVFSGALKANPTYILPLERDEKRCVESLAKYPHSTQNPSMSAIAS